MPDNQIGPIFLGVLGLGFSLYGVRELALAYFLEPVGEWFQKAFLGANSLMLGALFACCSYRLVAGAEGINGVIARAWH